MQIGEALDKIGDRKAEMGRDSFRLALAEAHKARPAAAIATTLAEVRLRNFGHQTDLARMCASR